MSRSKSLSAPKKGPPIPRDQIHEFIGDTSMAADHRGERRCTCGYPRKSRFHAVGDVPEEAREIDARRLGEGGPQS